VKEYVNEFSHPRLRTLRNVDVNYHVRIVMAFLDFLVKYDKTWRGGGHISRNTTSMIRTMILIKIARLEIRKSCQCLTSSNFPSSINYGKISKATKLATLFRNPFSRRDLIYALVWETYQAFSCPSTSHADSRVIPRGTMRRVSFLKLFQDRLGARATAQSAKIIQQPALEND